MRAIRRRLPRFAVLAILSAAAVAVLMLGAGSSGAALTGAGAQKNCDSPKFIGDPIVCTYAFQNQDDFGNNETVNSLVDVTQTAGGAQSSGNIFSSVGWIFDPTPNAGTNPNASPVCVGGSGSGTPADPYFGATSCSVPVSIVNIMGTNFTIGARIRSAPFSWYTSTKADFNLPNHQLSDQDDFTWKCTAGNGSSCNPNANNHATAPATVLLQQRPSNATTTIHNAAHAPVTLVAAGTTVHDFVHVGSPNPDPNPANAPSGNVNVDWFLNGTCTGTPDSNSGSVGPINANGDFDVTSFTKTPLTAGMYSFKGHYEGDGEYLGSDGACEPLQVVDANIQITPATATNAVGTNHVLTITVNALGGTIDAGPHTATASIVSGPGSFVGSPSCTYTGGAATASCTVTITSASTGTTVVSATSNIPVNGQTITRTTATNPGPGGSGNASKVWVDANINITPATATNAVGTNHVLTITVNALGGTIDAGPHTATASILSGPGSFVGPNTCTYTGGAATASCTVTITSAVVGTTVVQATSDIPVNGQTITRTTGTAANTAAGGSGNASKTWVNANIQISPANATNAVNTNHVLTITVNAIGGTIDPGPHTATASIVSGPGSFVGPNTCTYAGGAATASCTVTITSAAVGTTLVSATSDIPVNGQTITRTTGTAVNTAAGGSDNANKVWVDANIQITPANATNPTGTNHVLTITVNALGGTIDAGPHTATASIVSGPGTFVGGNACTYTGGGATASCTVTITSTAVGTTVVSATSNIPVNGQTITRTTNTAVNTAAGGSGNASKVWVDANINITPANATNPIGTNHVLTITVNALGGTIDPGPHTATASIVSGPGGFVGSPSCTYTGGAATASCTVTISSNVPGTTVVQATSNIPVNGQTITRTTGTAANTASGGSGNASKLWLQPDANIQITPATATNAVGTNHTLHCHINVSVDGTTFTNAPAGTICTVTITSGPGTPVAQNCSTAGATGTCDVVITSSAVGTSVINASTTVTVNGIVLTRTTNGTAGNSGPAQKLWVDANIQITPATATNAVGTNHVLTITVNALGGTIDAGPHTATASIVSGPGSFVGSPSCTYTGGAATASCTVTITSAATGTTVVSATSNIPVSGQTISRTTATNPGPGGSGNASKLWVDANIAITPASANNPIGSNHVLTITVNALGGTLDAGPHTATASIVSGPGGFVGSPSCTYTGGAATASCTVTITSNTAGTTVVQATATIPVNGQSITRTTGTAANITSGGSGNASKNWLDDTVTTRVLDAANNEVTNTTVPSGTVVHDEATVTKTANTPAAAPAPTGSVTFKLFDNASCNGNVLATDTNVALAGGKALSSNFTTPNSGGLFSYLAHYNGDANYPAHDAACEPFQVNAVQGNGRITGGGSIFDTVDGVPNTRITHGFELRCTPNDPRQSLEINWAGGNNFHLEKIINSVVCFDDPLLQPPPPPNTVFDTYAGNTLFNGKTGYHGFGYAVGTGICNKLPAMIYFILVDAGEPGTSDVAEYHITGGCTLNVGPAFLDKGNHQFHKN